MASLSIIANPEALERIKRVSDVTGRGNYREDSALGRVLAKELAEEMDAAGFYATFGHIVQDWVKTGTFTAVQIGFCQRMAELAAAGLR